MRHLRPAIPRRFLLAVLAATATAPLGAAAQDIGFTAAARMVIPYPAGSTPDLVARLVAEHFRTVFGHPFVVDNRPGAGGNTGTGIVAGAEDGLTIGVSINGPLTTAKALYPELTYDPAADLALVSLLVRAPQLLVVHPDVPARDVAAFIAYSRAHPGLMSYGSIGVGSAGHLGMEELAASAGIELVHVPYKGFPEAVLDLVAGRIQAMVLTASAILPQVEAGKVRALAVTAEQRVPQAPAVPTMAEAGMPDATSYAWIGLIAPRATPQALALRLADEARVALTHTATRAKLERAGFQIIASTPSEFVAFAAEETSRWTAVARRLGLAAGR